MRNHLLTDLLSVLLGMALSVVPSLPCLAGGPAGERSALDDLPSRHITALAEGPDGYLWLGTRDGLYRYSGSGVRAYLHTDDPASLPGNLVTGLVTDSAGTLWVATNRGICALRGDRLTYPTTRDEELITFLMDWDENHLLVSSHFGLSSFDKVAGTFTLLANHSDLRRVRMMVKTGVGRICLVPESRTEVTLLDNRLERVGGAALPAGALVTGLVALPSGLVGVATTRGLMLLTGDTCQPVALPPALATATQGRELAFACTKDGRLAVGVVGSGVVVYDEQTQACTLIGDNDVLEPGAECMAVLTPQDVWFSQGHDIPRQLTIEQANCDILLPQLRRDECIYDLIPEEGNNFFLKTNQRIFHVNPSSRTCRDVTPGDLRGERPDRNLIYDPTNRIMVFTTDFRTLRAYYWEDGRLDRPRVFPVGEFSCIWNDSEGCLYVLQRQELTILTPSGQRIRQYLPEDLGIFVAYHTRTGQTYFIDESYARLYTFDREQGFTLVKKDLGGILKVNQTQRGRVWVSTYTDGLVGLDEEGREWLHLTQADGLPSNTVTLADEDTEGNVWACTQAGVIRIDAHDHGLTYLSNPHSSTNLFYLNSCTALVNNGRVYFGGNNCLTELDPASALPGSHIPIGLDAIWVNNREVSLLRDTIYLAHDDNNVSFHFSALSFNPDAQLNYAYRLEPRDDDYTEAGTAQVAQYTGLWPGTYTFKARVKTPAGDWSEHELMQTFVIYYNWWMTPVLSRIYMTVIVVLLAVGVGFVLRRRRQHQALVRKVMLLETARKGAGPALSGGEEPVPTIGQATLREPEQLVEQGTGREAEQAAPETAGDATGQTIGQVEEQADGQSATPLTDPYAGQETNHDFGQEVSQEASQEAEVQAEQPLDQPTTEEAVPTVELNPRDRRMLEKVYQLMDEQLSNETFNISNLAKDLGMSRSSFYLRIKSLTGQSPQSLLNSYRLDKAMALLQTHEFNVSEVCYRVGFATRSGFSRSFKSKFGIAPSEV